MPNNLGGMRLRAGLSSRGEHPDLKDSKVIDRGTAEDRAQDEFNERYADAGWRDRFMQSVAQRQGRLPADIQAQVAGITWPGDSPHAQVSNYETAKHIAAARSSTIYESQIASMSPDQYDVYFDERGRIRPGYRLVYDRATPLSDLAGEGRSPSSYTVDRRFESVEPSREY
jgi:hypothetical protein